MYGVTGFYRIHIAIPGRERQVQQQVFILFSNMTIAKLLIKKIKSKFFRFFSYISENWHLKPPKLNHSMFNPMKQRALLFAALAFTFASAACTKTFYVSPDGNDSNKGSKGSPFLTIGKAVKAAEGNAKRVTVILRDGEYPMSEAVRMNGLKDFSIVAAKDAAKEMRLPHPTAASCPSVSGGCRR